MSYFKFFREVDNKFAYVRHLADFKEKFITINI